MSPAAVCCAPLGSAGNGNGDGLSVNVPGGGVGGGVNTPGSGASITERLAQAIDAAVHPDSSVTAITGNGSGRVGGNVIEFPVVNPYGPIIRTRAPVSGMNAFPRINDLVNFGFRTEIFNGQGNEDAELPAGSESLGFSWEGFPGSSGSGAQEFPQGISLPSSSNPSNLQLILDTIARTLPATISAAKKQPYYDPAASQYAQQGQAGYAYQGQAGSSIGSQLGSAVGGVGDTFGNIIAEHPYLILAGGAALVLLFMSPPRRR